jgi:hypothetical protein
LLSGLIAFVCSPIALLSKPAPVSLGAADRNQRVRGDANVGSAFHRIPEQIPCHEDVISVVKCPVEPLLDRHNPLELKGIFSHRLIIAFRVDDRRRTLWNRNTHRP